MRRILAILAALMVFSPVSIPGISPAFADENGICTLKGKYEGIAAHIPWVNYDEQFVAPSFNACFDHVRNVLVTHRQDVDLMPHVPGFREDPVRSLKTLKFVFETEQFLFNGRVTGDGYDLSARTKRSLESSGESSGEAASMRSVE